eukprot:CAMPEP_0181175746 /NCGR_PEP_ID=MMETSP1096-20121128/4247_1 /TAXON_ID=156174 ORGANISM="Chrysochromulina ericina, Strain CCMP281" /NCGR_SAMPLE_ID=MMETSP1096 /ASSEMBLY_ACC=CAM_ASM_000453 /LENGTH=38 /DNA_ID= /DNA_START= /DNA_END= /DNA_ORIENTATION=
MPLTRPSQSYGGPSSSPTTSAPAPDARAMPPRAAMQAS